MGDPAYFFEAYDYQGRFVHQDIIYPQDGSPMTEPCLRKAIQEYFVESANEGEVKPGTLLAIVANRYGETGKHVFCIVSGKILD